MNLSVTKNDQELFKIDLGQEIFEGQGEVSFFIGRSEDSHVFLDDRRISREHAAIIYKGDKWVLESIADNLIQVNNNNIQEHTLAEGDIIDINPYRIVIGEITVLESSPSEVENLAVEEEVAVSTETISEDELQPINEEEIDLDNEALEDEGSGDEFGEGESDLGLEEDQDAGFDIEDNESGFEGDGELNNEGFSEDLEFSDSEESGDGLDDFAENDSEGGFEDDSEPFQETYNEDYQDEDGSEGFPAAEFDGGYDDYDGDDGTKIIQSFATTTLIIEGRYAPYDKYVVEKNEVKIGRDPEKCDIVLSDPEVSGVHGTIKKSNITCILEDMNSANGTLLNGERINSATLTNGDEFIIGATTFTVQIVSDFLQKEEQRLMPVEDNQVVEVEEIVEVAEGDDIDEDLFLEAGDAAAQDTSQSLFSKDALKNPEKRKKLLYIVVGLLALWVVLDEDKPKKPKPTAKKENSRLLDKADPNAQNNAIESVSEKPLTEEQKEFVDSTYRLAVELFDVGRYQEVLDELAKIHGITPKYKNSKQYEELAKEGLGRLARLAEEKRQAEEKKRKQAKVKELVSKAKTAVKERNISMSEMLFGEIAKLDPENFELTQMKLEIESHKREEERKALEKAQKEAERRRQLEQLAPGKNFYLKGDWYRAILKLEDYLRKENLDEDLRKEGAKMLKESKDNLAKVIDPMLGRARSLKEGQDLKGAYEIYLDIYKRDPGREEVLKEMFEIRESLELRSRKIYREAIIAESLSLFDAAKEKFQEVQQLSPVDSEYYKKATEKLKSYLD